MRVLGEVEWLVTGRRLEREDPAPGGGRGGILSLHVALRQAGIEDGPRRSKCPRRGSHRRAPAFALRSALENPYPILPYPVQLPSSMPDAPWQLQERSERDAGWIVERTFF